MIVRKPNNARSHLAWVGAIAAIGALLLCASSAAAAPFGMSSFDVTFTGPNGEAVTQAGAHPYQMETSFMLNSEPRPGGGIQVAEPLKDLQLGQVVGFAGNPTAVPRCSAADFITFHENSEGTDIPDCPAGAALGIVGVEAFNLDVTETIWSAVYNLDPPPGVAAQLGFWTANQPVTVELGVSEAPPYNILGGPLNVSQAVGVISAHFVLWGVPADPAHDSLRGPCAGGSGPEPRSLGKCAAGSAPKSFLTMPRACAGPLATTFALDSWVHPGTKLANGRAALSDPNWLTGSVLTHDVAGPMGMTGCAALGFSPEITAKPTSRAAESASGLDFSLDINHNEGLEKPSYEATSDADVEKAVVTLPEDMTANPSSASGLGVCTEGQLAAETAFSNPGEGCPDASKLGSIEVETPLLEEVLKGSLYLAKPYENPEHTLVALYVVIKSPKLGVSVKLPLKVEPNPATGQLVTISEGLPQIPFSHFRLHFREGPRAPLVTPPGCGTHAAKALLYPSSGGPPVASSSTFEIVTGSNTGPCPSGTQPFHPSLEAGTLNNVAGSYSPFALNLARTDAEQEITHFSVKLPPGVTGKLAGIPFCPETAIAAAKAREGTQHGGEEELASPSCPAASQIGTTIAGAGVGNVLTYVPGKVYMAGPYKGSNLSIVAITAAQAGPFDLGTVVIREALKVDPVTAEVSVDAAGSDPLPHILGGIPVDLRDLRVSVDRPGFVLNPTSCEPASTASIVQGSGTNFASEADDQSVTVTSRFQAANCASLAFKPKVKLTLSGSTKRTGLPRLEAVVTARPGDANISRAVVTLPKSEFLEQGHIGTTCTRVQFNAGGGNGEQCPAKSIYGHAKAVTPLLSEPLEGPVYLRSNGGERRLPDLVAALHSTDIDINLLGFIDSLRPKGSDISRIRTIFATVPDAPVTKFTLSMFGGKKGLLVNSANLCKGEHRAISKFVAQNGRRSETRPAVEAQCPQKVKVTEVKRRGKKGKSRNATLARTLRQRVAW